ncbi:MAG: bifunctional helix-turn-helix transcriptional regulator/GNAT family N-acetyltransferase [Gammaproteobacteria bacterium]|jgi:DNA-binding MarR family transcriptional regulator/GNAT superfamily N-acetyltransferase
MVLPDPQLVADIRLSSRELVRRFGLMSQTVAGTDLSLSAVHAIIEIGRSAGLSSKDLSEKLQLEKSTVSRLVKSLVAGGEIREERSKNDMRMKFLHLTPRGKRTLRAIDEYAETQVSNALGGLDADSRLNILTGLQQYAAAMKTISSDSEVETTRVGVEICAGYTPGIVGRVVEMLHLYMHRHYDFGVHFEARIAGDLAEFVSRIESPANQIWRAEKGGRIAGSISIDGEDLGDGLAHLRWFIVDSGLRGTGVGEALLSAALEFCDRRGYRETQLWTVKGLDAARRLYLKHGFVLAEEYFGNQWGSRVLEQKYTRTPPR